MQAKPILTGELQLGQTLNHCVRDGKKSEFDLLLSMLSTDVCEQDQFAMDNDASHLISDDQDPTIALRDQFSVPEPQTLLADSVKDAQYSLSLGERALNEGLLASRLQHCLHQDALSFETGKVHGIDVDVFDSLSPTTARRFTQQSVKREQPSVNFDDLIAAQKSYQAELLSL